MKRNPVSEDQWVPTSCNGCFNVCAIRTLKKDGKLVAVKGDPDVESSGGKVCGKSIARLTELYDPKRVTRPLKRTNPQKGIGVDPGWVEISWDEALDTVTSVLQKVRDDDPRKLMIADFDIHNFMFPMAFGEAFGTPNYTWSTIPCGNGLHTVFWLTLGGLNSEIDLENCNYIVLWGSQLGSGSNNNCMESIRHMADARRRGARVVVIDPVCGHAAAKADEWVPILPGTDAALALGLANVMVNTLKGYDEKFLKNKTNGPYLIDDRGRYLRHPESRKPLIWDLADNSAREFDDPDLTDPALEGEFTAAGEACRPSFHLLKNHLRDHYPLDKVSRLTTVPEETISRLAREFVAAACIGQDRKVEDYTIAYRPAAIEFKRGITHHKNAFGNCFSLMVPNLLIGNPDAIGGLQGTAPHGPMGAWGIDACPDGLVFTNFIDNLSAGHGVGGCFYRPYPPAEAGPPTGVALRELFPASGFISMLQWLVLKDPAKVGLEYKPSVLINCRNNVIMSHNNAAMIAERLKEFDFILGFGIKVNETLEFADIVLPENHDFEKWTPVPTNLPGGFQKPGPGRWYMQATQPAVDPPAGVRNWNDVLMDIAHRMGFGAELNQELNNLFAIGMVPDLALEPERLYTVEDLTRRTGQLYSMMGGREDAADLFTVKAPVVDVGPKSVEEVYPIQTSAVRVPIYMEHLLGTAEEVRKVAEKLGLDWWDFSHYAALPDWRPCPAHESTDPDFDLYLHSGKVPLSTHTIGTDNVWLTEIMSRNRMDMNIVLNRETGRKKGLVDGDRVVVESKVGRVEGVVRLSDCVHPQVAAGFAQAGRWARDAIGHGTRRQHLNGLIDIGWHMIGGVTGQMDTCARLKIRKTGA
ncbi:MAG: molybdopterin-dependent oxidoreductase [Pseudomonadota bacterium]